MKFFGRHITVCVCMTLMACFFYSCGKPKEGRVAISEQEFSIRQDSNHSWVIDARGKIKNVGEVDVKNVVVTGYCKSCGEVIVSGVWFFSDIEKTAEEKDIIGYLPAGDDEDFSFKGIAYLMDQSGRAPAKMPDQLECEVVSFETAEK
jgi:hypothetical protein